jgi:2-polyprenyl-3-methyl-5-hydroxy-6-metoxy-1,4-benzoquinol methylase
VIGQPLEDLLTRLERERLDADRLYNDALTAVNRAIQAVPMLPEAPVAHDGARLADLNRTWNILATGTAVAGRGWGARLRAFIWRLVGPPLEQQQQFNAALVDHLNRNDPRERALPETTADVIAALRQALEGVFRFESLLVQYLMTITAFVDSRDRRLGAQDLAAHLTFVEQRIAAIAREMDRLQARSTSEVRPTSGSMASTEVFAAPVDSTTYVGFEDRFRGSQDDIRLRVEDYLPILGGAADVVDVGCGRGELLDALRAHSIRARGVDANHAMVELCRARGLDVEESDALSFLERQPAGSLGGLVAIQVVEHFAPAYLSQFLAAAHQALKPGAPLVLETINPACWAAFFDTYIRDLTHQRPLHPETLKYLVQASGFAQVDVQFRQPVRSVDRLDRVDDQAAGAADSRAVSALIAAVNAHADKLNARIFSHFDYAVVARR